MHPGDKITAQLQLAAQGAVLSDIDIMQQANLNVLPPVQYHVPQPGDAVPDFSFLNQSNREISFHQFHGKVLVLTFIYTRCASSEFCPLMSRNFADLDQMLAADPGLYGKTHLLSISFDPKYDTPAVLRSYGGAYTGRYTKETFQHWDFAAPSPAKLASVLQWFDVAVNTSNGKCSRIPSPPRSLDQTEKFATGIPPIPGRPSKHSKIFSRLCRRKNSRWWLC